MVDSGVILSLGKGGPGDPHRYCVDPRLPILADALRDQLAK